MFRYVQKIMQTCGASGDSLKEKLTPIGGKFTEIGEHAKALWVAIQPVMTKIGGIAKEVFKGVLGGAIGAAIGFLKGLATSAEDTIGGVLKIFDGLIVFLTGVFTGNWRKAFEGLKEIFAGVFESLAGLCKTPLNAVIGLITSSATRPPDACPRGTPPRLCRWGAVFSHRNPLLCCDRIRSVDLRLLLAGRLYLQSLLLV